MKQIPFSINCQRFAYLSVTENQGYCVLLSRHKTSHPIFCRYSYTTQSMRPNQSLGMTGQKSGNMLRQPLHSSMTQTRANILCFKQEQWRIHTGANMDELLKKKASRNGRSGNMAVEQGRFQHVKSYTHMLNLTSAPLPSAQCAQCVRATEEGQTYY